MPSAECDIPATLRSDLRADEGVVSFTWARLPRKRTAYTTLAPIGTVISLVDLFRSRAALEKVRQRAGVVGFPLDRRMGMAVTDDRLVIWGRRLGSATMLGGVPRSRIASARLPYIGGGWRVVEIRLVDGLSVRFLADRDHAEGFVKSL